MRLRPVVWGVLGLTLVLAFFMAQQFAELPEVSFVRAVQMAQEQPSEERAPTVMIRGVVHAVPQPGSSGLAFWMQDGEGSIFAVEYTGGKALPPLRPGDRVAVLGHAHGGASPYFHASDVRLEQGGP